RKLSRREERQENEEAHRETHTIRSREQAHDDPERREEDGKERPDHEPHGKRVADETDAAPEEPHVRDGDRERPDPEGERRDELPGSELESRHWREEQALEAASLALAAHRVGGSEETEERADRDRDLERQVHRLPLLEEVERVVGRDQVGDDAQEDA